MLDRFFDKDILDEYDLRNDNATRNPNTIAMVQLSRDIKNLILAIRSLKAELDGDIQ